MCTCVSMYTCMYSNVMVMVTVIKTGFVARVGVMLDYFGSGLVLTCDGTGLETCR